MLPLLEKLIVDSEYEVRSEALHTMIHVGWKCDSKIFVDTITIPISTKLVTDPSVHVRASLAEGVCMISSVIGAENMIDHFIPVISQLMKDNHTEIWLAIMSHIGEVCWTIGKE